MSKRKIPILVFVCFLFSASTAHADWLVYHKPEFAGKIIDAETKAPIEGAVVAVYYTKDTMTFGDGGKSSVIHTKEAVTDENGEFVIPSYTTFIQPLSTEAGAGFIIYKPGYTSRLYVSPEKFFLKEMAGQKKEYMRSRTDKVKFTYGILEMRRLETRKERIRSIPRRPLDCGPKELPFLYKLINEENRRFGMEDER